MTMRLTRPARPAGCPLRVCGLLVLLAGCSRAPDTPPVVINLADSLRPAVEGTAPGGLAPRWGLIQAVYREREYRPVWLVGQAPGPRARELAEALCAAESQGLRRGSYDLPGLIAALRLVDSAGPTSRRLVEAELRLTGLFLDYGTQLYRGQDPASVDTAWTIPARHAEVDSVLHRAMRGATFADMVAPLLPSQPQYAELVRALSHYRALAAAGGWPAVPAPARPKLVPGDRDSALAALRRRLAVTGELADTAAPDSTLYDRTLAAAVVQFQRDHGLEPDSVLGRGTLAELNVTAEHRVRQIELNMERLRWLAHDLGERYILVNIPAFRLEAHDSGEQVFSMRVVVGKDYKNPTPVFTDTMTYVVFRPYWNVPRRIINEELLPAQKRDTAYLGAHAYEILQGGDPVEPAAIDWAKADTLNFLRYHIRQKPGGQNSLGHVKFMLPNQYDVYLHDTPAQSLFRRAGRNASHGCIRVERPQQLAEWVLDGVRRWDTRRIREALRDTTPPEEVILARRVPVFIVYLTAFVEDGAVQFRQDLYGNDARAIARLEAMRPDAPEGAGACGELRRLVDGGATAVKVQD